MKNTKKVMIVSKIGILKKVKSSFREIKFDTPHNKNSEFKPIID